MGSRSGDITQPICPKCGGIMLAIKGHGRQCTRCDKPGARQQPGGYQATLKDGTVKYFDTEKELTDFLGRKDPKKRTPPPASTAVAPSNLSVDQPGAGKLPSTDIAFELIDKELQATKFESLAEAKKILSLRKKLNSLRFDIKTLIGGK